MLKSIGIDDLLHFDFMDPPPPETLIKAQRAWHGGKYRSLEAFFGSMKGYSLDLPPHPGFQWQMKVLVGIPEPKNGS